MKQIMRCRFGSHLYGTSTPASDVDYKSVFIPSGADILLQRVKNTVGDEKQKAHGEKNQAGDVDEEKFSIQKFLTMVCDGDMMALDVLFAPNWAMTDEPSWQWSEIRDNRARLLSKKPAGFLSYMMHQAKKYGIRGSRVAAARAALAVLEEGFEKHGTTAKLVEISTEIEAATAENEFMLIVDDQTPQGKEFLMWAVCDRKMPFTASIKNGRDIMARVVEQYGQRALMAESNNGVDWKALSHAIRVGGQALELLTTGHITFPLPNAEYILEIKQAGRDYKDVAVEIEDLLQHVEAASAASALPEEPDRAWVDQFVAGLHRDEALDWRP